MWLRFQKKTTKNSLVVKAKKGKSKLVPIVLCFLTPVAMRFLLELKAPWPSALHADLVSAQSDSRFTELKIYNTKTDAWVSAASVLSW